uniref:Uncharacterized protein n=1 Tax=Tanacetum cinerariifolium TaxID=118510 RepID=A0A6L2NK70_TANCI|nr:hypothetical protein [Tanacetum cinerariifolium]
MAPLPPKDQGHPWLRYQVKGYTVDIMHGFEQRIEMIFGRSVNQVHVLDFARLTDEMRGTLPNRFAEEMTEDGFEAYWLGSMRVIPDKGILGIIGLRFYQTWIFWGRLPLMNTSETLHAEGRNSGSRLSRGYFIGHLAAHFGLISDEGLKGLSVITSELPMIDLHELVWLNICVRLGDTWSCVAPRLERQPTTTAPQPPPPTPARTIAHRLSVLEDEVNSLRGDMGEQRGVLDNMTRDFSRFTMWTVTSLSRMMDQSEVRYTRYSDSSMPHQRRTRRRTGDANTSIA